MNTKMFHRQLSVINEDAYSYPITVIGAGAVGGTIVLVLAKMGFNNVTVYDNDTVEIHNVPNQMYGKDHVGLSKVEALNQITSMLTGVKIQYKEELFGAETPVDPYTLYISAVDSLAARRNIWKRLKGLSNLYLDTRMGLEQGSIRLIQCDNTDYEKSLDIKPSEAACTARSIMYTPFVMAGYIGWIVKALANKEEIKIPSAWYLGIGGMTVEAM